MGTLQERYPTKNSLKVRYLEPSDVLKLQMKDAHQQSAWHFFPVFLIICGFSLK